ncbi:MAG TPA: phosphatidate cytidylyltransferase [Candidatus Dormibacteraeota bacterium]|nr:phosphatidate cytidylyltransferase [Candidatus Dormibacteraeota bacterium]
MVEGRDDANLDPAEVRDEVSEPRRLNLPPLLIRALSAVVLIAVFVGLLAIGWAGLLALVAIVTALALWEFQRLSGLMGFRAPLWLLFPIGFFFTFSGTLFVRVPVELVLAVALIGGLSVFLFVPGRRQGLGPWAMSLAGGIYLGMPFNYYLLLYTHDQGLIWLVTVVATVVIADVVALLVGSAVGRHPFLPRISPKKTWEGAIAGLAVCVPVFLLSARLLLHFPWWHAVVLGLLVGIAGLIGDLVESQMKRLAGVKDSSNLIPGHGGVLDRIDSLLFAPIVVFLYAQAFHLWR